MVASEKSTKTKKKCICQEQRYENRENQGTIPSDGLYFSKNEMCIAVSYETGYYHVNYCPMCGRKII